MLNFFSLSSSLFLPPPFLHSFPPFFPLLSLFLLPSVSSFLHCFFSFCLLLFNHHERSSQKSHGDLKSQPLRFFIIWSTFPMQTEQRMPPLHPSRMNTPLSFPLFPLTPSSPALTGCDHPCLHLLSALALFFILCLHCCTGLSPVSGGGGTLAVVRGLLIVAASCTVDMILVAPRHVGSPWIRNQTHFSHIGRQIPYHWATREGPCLDFSAPLNYLPLSFKV